MKVGGTYYDKSKSPHIQPFALPFTMNTEAQTLACVLTHAQSPVVLLGHIAWALRGESRGGRVAPDGLAPVHNCSVRTVLVIIIIIIFFLSRRRPFCPPERAPKLTKVCIQARPGENFDILWSAQMGVSKWLSSAPYKINKSEPLVTD